MACRRSFVSRWTVSLSSWALGLLVICAWFQVRGWMAPTESLCHLFWSLHQHGDQQRLLASRVGPGTQHATQEIVRSRLQVHCGLWLSGPSLFHERQLACGNFADEPLVPCLLRFFFLAGRTTTTTDGGDCPCGRGSFDVADLPCVCANCSSGSLPFLDKIKETVCVPPEPRTLKMTSFPAALHTHECFTGPSKKGSTRLVWGRQARCDESFASRVTCNFTEENWNVLSIRRIVFELACRSSQRPLALIWSLHDTCSGLSGGVSW